MKTTIRTKDDTCDLDDGIYFSSNPNNVSSTTLQKWVKDAVEGITDAIPSHRNKCITIDYKAGYNIDLPVFVFDENEDEHPYLAVKNLGFRMDDPKEFVDQFNEICDSNGQLIRIVRYLKAWCDCKREKMPSGLVMTVLAMDHFLSNERDDIALKFILIEIEKTLKQSFKCKMPTTPQEDLLEDFDKTRQNNFMTNLTEFIKDAKKAIDEEKNNRAASKLWQKHLGKIYFPDGIDEDETIVDSTKLNLTIGSTKPYYNVSKL